MVSAYVRRQLYPHTQAARARIDASAVSEGRVRSLADLQAVEPVDLADVGDGAEYVVRPTRQDLLRSGSPYLRARTLWASTWGRWNSFLRAIDPLYRPVHFFTADGVPVGAAAADLVRLAGMGVEWLRALGIGREDTIALVGGATARIEPWQLSGGTRRAGISLAVLDDPAGAARHNVSVVAGTPDAVRAALRGGAWPALRLALVFDRDAQDQVAGIDVRRAWAPQGTRSVWFECRGGREFGWHTSPAAELIDLDDDEVIWTGIGWAGTVFFRLRTDLRAERLDDGSCRACGHVGPRLFVGEGRPSLARWLRLDDRVAEVRLTADGADVLPVRAGAHARLVSEARKRFPDQTVTIKNKKTWVS